MKAFSRILLIGLLCSGFCVAQELKLAHLPEPVTNNAVAALKIRGGVLLFSFMGMGSKKTWDAITNTAYYLDPDWDKWYPLKPIPGTAGRIGAAAAAARGTLFVFGGYVVDAQNRGQVVPDVDVYDVQDHRWSRGEDMPTPVADAVVAVYRDRYVYVIGGRGKTGTIGRVQIYDTENSKWIEATAPPGAAVFGHSGAILDDTIVFVDGAYRDTSSDHPGIVTSDQCWAGKINRKDLSKIEWSKLPPHPGTARFRIAAGSSDKDDKIYFTGGTDSPYDYTGIGYEGKPAEPSPTTFAFNRHNSKWEVINENTPNPTMDNRQLLVIRENLVTVGGMEKAQEVTARVAILPLKPKSK
jgi:N-acetylneuraminic acid mutarotase